MARREVDIRWHARAACEGQDQAPFFPSHEEEGLEAVAPVCRRCPVRVECLTHALVHREPGLWAATTTHGRRKLRRRRCVRCGGTISLDELARQACARALEWRCTACGGVRAVRKAPDPEVAERARRAALRSKARWTPAPEGRRRSSRAS